MIVALLPSRFLRKRLAFLPEGSRLTLAFPLDFLEALSQQFHLCLKLLNDLDQLFALRAIGVGLRNIHDPTSMSDLRRFLQGQFPPR